MFRTELAVFSDSNLYIVFSKSKSLYLLLKYSSDIQFFTF